MGGRFQFTYLHTPRRIVKEAEAPLHIGQGNLGLLPPLSQQVASHDEIARIAQPGLLAHLREQGQGVGAQVDLLFLCTNTDDLLDLIGGVRLGADDDNTVQEIQRQAVRRLVLGTTDAGVTSVRGHDDDGGEVVLEGAVDEGETFNVEHMHLVDEEHAGDDGGLPFLLPLGHFGVDLVANLTADLTGVTSKQCQEALRPAVDDIDLVKADSVGDLATLLELAIRAGQELGIGAHGVVVACTGVGAAQLGDLAGGFVNADDIACHDLLLRHRINHLRAHVVDGLHVGGFDGEFALLIGLPW